MTKNKDVKRMNDILITVIAKTCMSLKEGRRRREERRRRKEEAVQHLGTQKKPDRTCDTEEELEIENREKKNMIIHL